MIPNIYDGDSLTHPDLLEIAETGGTAPTRIRVGFASTGTTAAAMASASQLIAYHTERDSGFDQVPVIKGELASEAEAREVLSLPIYQSPNGLPSTNNQAEIYRFDAGGTTLYMGVAASGEIINISARIDDIPNEPIIHAGPSPQPQRVEKPEGFAIHESDTRPETLPIADDGIVWRHTGHDVEPVDFRDYILTVDRKDVKPVYVSLNESKNVTNSVGETVERKFVEDQDGLLEEAEKAAGGSLDNFKPIKEHWYESPDGTRRIEWNPDGHKNTNEGPHVTIRDYNGKRYGVTDKIFIKGREKYDGKP